MRSPFRLNTVPKAQRAEGFPNLEGPRNYVRCKVRFCYCFIFIYYHTNTLLMNTIICGEARTS
jgi:hypothetical protein